MPCDNCEQTALMMCYLCDQNPINAHLTVTKGRQFRDMSKVIAVK